MVKFKVATLIGDLFMVNFLMVTVVTSVNRGPSPRTWAQITRLALR
ncbi:hypothetical protein Hanom_Chr14g01334501 [Helianthus anomalus]